MNVSSFQVRFYAILFFDIQEKEQQRFVPDTGCSATNLCPSFSCTVSIRSVEMTKNAMFLVLSSEDNIPQMTSERSGCRSSSLIYLLRKMIISFVSLDIERKMTSLENQVVCLILDISIMSISFNRLGWVRRKLVVLCFRLFLRKHPGQTWTNSVEISHAHSRYMYFKIAWHL